MDIILATTSKIKSKLLSNAGIGHLTIGTNVLEQSDSKDVYEYVKDISYLKASAIKEEGIIIGIDTIVYCNNKIYEKPKNLIEVKNNMEELNGSINSVITGITIIDKYKNKVLKTFDETKVYIRKMIKEDIDFYMASEPDVLYASGYIIENTLSCFVDKIEGSYYNILGMPVNKIVEELYKLGYTIKDIKK